MKDEKMGTCSCGGCGCGHHGFLGKKLYMAVGTFALVYGVVTWLGTTYMWTTSVEWVVGGVLLLLVGWFKKWLCMKKGM